MTENFPNLEKEMNTHIHETQIATNRLNIEIDICYNQIPQKSKSKRNLKAREEQFITYKGAFIKLKQISQQKLQVRRM